MINNYNNQELNTKEGSYITPPNLEQEYLRWLCVKQILQGFRKIFPHSRHFYEARNILERWILSSINFTSSYQSVDEVFSQEILNTEHDINQKFREEMMDKQLADEEKAYEILLSVHNQVEKYLKTLEKGLLSPDFSQLKIRDSGNICYKKYRESIHPNRLEILRKKGGTNEQIASMLLRYSSLIPGGQHWSIPADVYQSLHQHYGVDIEGFASPINSQLLRINPECQFCSLFPTTDRIFGSIGNFFSASFLSHSVSANPPYVEDIINRMAEKIEEQCTLAEIQEKFVRFFVTIAAWRDCKGFLRMAQSKYCTYQKILPKNRHFYENLTQKGRAHNNKIIARFETAFFVLEVGNKERPITYAHLLDGMEGI